MSMGAVRMGGPSIAKRAMGGAEEDKAPLDFKLIARLLGYTKPYALKRNGLLLCVVVRSMQLPCLVAIVKATITGPIANDDPRGLMWGIIAFIALALFTQITFHFRSLWASQLGELVIHDLRNDMFAQLQRMPMSYFNRMSLGRIISRMTSDVENVRMGVQDVLFVSMVQGGQMLGAAGFMIYYDWKLFLLVLGMVPILYGLNRIFHKRMSEAHRNVQESFSRVTANLAESVSGIRVTQSFVRQEHSARAFGELIVRHAGYNMDAARARGQFLPLLEINSQLFLAILIVVGGYFAMQPGLSPDQQTQAIANLVGFFFMANLFFSPVVNLGMMYDVALTSMAGAERVYRLLDQKPDWTDPEDAAPLPPIVGRVEMRDVHFSYVPDKPVLMDVDFVAEPGQTVALVGHTGSGKTTIINLIAKFYLPTEGQILIDGHDLAKVRTDTLHRQMGIVLQVNFLFTGTVMDNIRLGRPSATDEQVMEAARKLDCYDILADLSQGFQTDVGEGGTNLSLGQRQLVCFCRAMLANPRIMILDEATSAVDTMTEARIQKSLSILLKQRTSFVVAHRLSTIRHADQVLVLDHGRIVERGTHLDLLATGGVYANLYRKFVRAGEA